MDDVKKCESCKMEEFWKGFIESSTFSQFLEYEGKLDDSYYKRYLDILSCVKRKEYKIYNSEPSYLFEIDKMVTPRTLLAVIKKDISSKPRSFIRESINILRKEVQAQLRDYSDYYRRGDSGNTYKPRRFTFSELNSVLSHEFHYLYYGLFGIIRVSTLLLSNLSLENFQSISMLNDEIFPKLNNQIRNR